MKRRTLLPGLAAMPLGFAGVATAGRRGFAAMTLEEVTRRAAERREQAVAALPYERVKVDGRDVIAVVERLRASGRGWPVVVGGDESLAGVAEPFGSDERSPADILKAAAGLEHPRDLLGYKADEERRAEEAFAAILTKQAPSKSRSPQDSGYVPDLLKSFGITVLPPDAPLAIGPAEPEVGAWPAEPSWLPRLTVTHDLEGRPLAKVHILLLPTDEGASVPAHVRWGGWNANPPPEYHVAALRS